MIYTKATPASSLRSEVDRLFDAAFAPVFGRDFVSAVWTPATDVRETEQEVVIEMELPGVAPESVELTADRGVLRVRGEKTSTHRASDQRVHLSERVHGMFERAFRLPKGLDESAIGAEFEHGLLRVRLPKSAIPQPRRIEVKVAQPSNLASGTQTGAINGAGSQNAGPEPVRLDTDSPNAEAQTN